MSLRGVPIDDYFYQLIAAAQDAVAPLRMAYLVLVSQVLPTIQNLLKEWVAAQVEVTKPSHGSLLLSFENPH